VPWWLRQGGRPTVAIVTACSISALAGLLMMFFIRLIDPILRQWPMSRHQRTNLEPEPEKHLPWAALKQWSLSRPELPISFCSLHSAVDKLQRVAMLLAYRSTVAIVPTPMRYFLNWMRRTPGRVPSIPRLVTGPTALPLRSIRGSISGQATIPEIRLKQLRRRCFPISSFYLRREASTPDYDAHSDLA